MKKFFFTFVLAVLAADAFAQAPETIEVDGLYYQVADGVATIVPPPDGTQYSGTVTIPATITLADGSEARINESGDISGPLAPFAESSVEEVIFDISQKPDIGGFRTLTMSFRYDNALKRMQFNNPITLSEDEYYFYSNVNLGNTPDCVHVYMRETETEGLLIVDKFNIYGPDGKQMRPLLRSEVSGEYIYPDDDNVFHLDKDWTADGEYCQVLKTSSYFVAVLFGMDEQGRIATVRTEPALTQTGLSTVYNGMCFDILYDGAALTGIEASASRPKEIFVPESVPYQGKLYPVTTISGKAFEGVTAESVTLPGTVTTVGNDAFYMSPSLKRVDMSKTQVTSLGWAFTDCENLEEVLLPETCVQYNSTFDRCPALKQIEIAEGSQCSLISYDSGLVETETEWVGGKTLRLTVTHWGITYIGGGELEHYPFKDWSYGYVTENNTYETVTVVYDGEPDGDSYLFKLSDFYTPNPFVANPSFSGVLNIGVHNDPEAEGGLKTNIYARVSISEPAASGIADRVVEPADGPAQFFNLQGLEVDGSNLAPGLYIRRQGNKASKVLVR